MIRTASRRAAAMAGTVAAAARHLAELSGYLLLALFGAVIFAVILAFAWSFIRGIFF